MEIDDVNEPFVEKEWIGQGRKYDLAKLPAFVTDARREIMAIPQIFYQSSGLPNPNLSVTKFLSTKLPHVSAELIPSLLNTVSVPYRDEDISSAIINAIHRAFAPGR
jgi:hypothetical protein